jgi:transcriptional regulator GlxA family with amidase domain
MTDRLITDERGIYTNGGAYSFLNLILYLIEKYCGREMAIYCAKVGEIDFERNRQSPFHIFTPQKNHDDEQVRAAQCYIENNIAEKISIDDLAKRCGLSKRNFERRFKKATADTPMGYIQKVKIEYAKKNFESCRKNVNEVMYDTGYCDRKAFRMAFKKVTGLLPNEYRQKYSARPSSLMLDM